MEELARKLEEKNREDRKSAWLLIALGIPVAVIGFAVISGLLFLLLLMLPPDGRSAAKGAVAAAVVLAAVVTDVWRHPSEHWHRGQYYLVDGRPAGPEAPRAASGMFAGVPLMASVTDPRNWDEHGERVSAGCSTLALGGARNIRKGVELLTVVRRRSRPDLLGGAAEAGEWLADHGPLAEEEIPTHLSIGFALADDLGRIGRRVEEGRKLVHAKRSD